MRPTHTAIKIERVNWELLNIPQDSKLYKGLFNNFF